MRGEDVYPVKAGIRQDGPPPHARGRPTRDEPADQFVGTTPACAGKTLAELGLYRGRLRNRISLDGLVLSVSRVSQRRIGLSGPMSCSGK